MQQTQPRPSPKPLLLRVSNADTGRPTTVRADAIKPSGLNTPLSADFRATAGKTYDRIARYNPAILGGRDRKGWVDYFSVESRPERELAAYGRIIAGAERYSAAHPSAVKRVVARVALLTSVNVVDIPSQVPGATDGMCEEMRRLMEV